MTISVETGNYRFTSMTKSEACFSRAEVRKLNEMYKSCVRHCRSLSRRLEAFLLDKQKLMDHFKGLSAEKLLYSHAVHMVSSHQQRGRSLFCRPLA